MTRCGGNTGEERLRLECADAFTVIARLLEEGYTERARRCAMVLTRMLLSNQPGVIIPTRRFTPWAQHTQACSCCARDWIGLPNVTADEANRRIARWELERLAAEAVPIGSRWWARDDCAWNVCLLTSTGEPQRLRHAANKYRGQRDAK